MMRLQFHKSINPVDLRRRNQCRRPTSPHVSDSLMLNIRMTWQIFANSPTLAAFEATHHRRVWRPNFSVLRVFPCDLCQRRAFSPHLAQKHRNLPLHPATPLAVLLAHRVGPVTQPQFASVALEVRLQSASSFASPKGSKCHPQRSLLSKIQIWINPLFHVWKHLDMSRTCCLNTLVLQQTFNAEPFRGRRVPTDPIGWSIRAQVGMKSILGINPSKKFIGIVIPRMENKSWKHHELSLQLGREKLMSVAHLTVKAETRLNSNNSCFIRWKKICRGVSISKRSPSSCQHFVSTAS